MGKTDRRVKRTRALLRQGLIQLMENKDIKDISVKELSDLADINRGTFYLHYSDIYDLLEKIEDNLFTEFNAILDRDMPEGASNRSTKSMILDIFTYLEKNRDITRVMIGPHGDLAFVNRLKELVRIRLQQIHEPAQASVYYFPFILSGFIGVIETWLAQESPASPEEMAELCTHILSGGFLSPGRETDSPMDL